MSSSKKWVIVLLVGAASWTLLLGGAYGGYQQRQRFTHVPTVCVQRDDVEWFGLYPYPKFVGGGSIRLVGGSGYSGYGGGSITLTVGKAADGCAGIYTFVSGAVGGR